jgi:lambda family phage portal protein
MRTPVISENGVGNHRFPKGILLDAGGEPINGRAPRFSNTGYSNYGANVQKNSLLGWLWRGGDADTDIGLNVQILRERSRDAFMGIPLAAGAIETLDTSVIGEGLYPAPAVDGEALGMSDTAAADLSKELADIFEQWACDPRECDYEMKDTFYTKQHVVFQSMLLSGDCPALFPLKSRPNCQFDLKLRVMEADRVRDPLPFTYPSVPNTTGFKNIFNGVELSNDGELAAYHIADRHPLASTSFGIGLFVVAKTFRVTPYGDTTGRRNMVLVMRPERPEQRRGVPILSVCLELLKQEGRYIDSTVLGAVIQSYFTAFILSDFPDPTTFDTLLTEDQKTEILNLNPYSVQMGPGVVNFMRPGHKVDFSKPTQPQSSFGDFTIAVAKFVGTALGIPYEVLLKQFNASYSASRAALLDFWRRVRKHRTVMVDGFCQPVYEELIADAFSLNLIKRFKGDFNDPKIRRALCRCVWTGSSAGSLDPQKEVQAAEQKVRFGFSTIERESSELNASNYRDNIRQQSIEQNEFEEADLIYPPNRAGRGGGFAPETEVTEPGQPAPPITPGEPVQPPKGGQPPQPKQPPQPAQPSASLRSRRKVALASGTSGEIIR